MPGEIFGFLTPGLTAKEKKVAFGFLSAAVPLFVVGCLTGLYIFPRMVEVLTSFASSEDSTFLQASYYFDFVFKIVIATEVAFVLPVFLVVLNFIGLLSARSIAKAWRVSIVAIVVFAALVTPASDVLSMFFVAAPMALLFLAALVIACSVCPTTRRSSVNSPACSVLRSTRRGLGPPNRWAPRTGERLIRDSTIRAGSSERPWMSRSAPGVRRPRPRVRLSSPSVPWTGRADHPPRRPAALSSPIRPDIRGDDSSPARTKVVRATMSVQSQSQEPIDDRGGASSVISP